jgi:hypothetical protein
MTTITGSLRSGLVAAALVLAHAIGFAGPGPVPGMEWTHAASPEAAGWSSDKLRF